MPTEREQLTSQVETLGTQANDLRTALLTARMPFVAGIVRGIEEALLVAYTMLKDSDAKEL
jgi:hypothetical protein